MEPIVNQIHKLLIKKKITLGVAESCTGGLLSKLLTDNPGSSQYFMLGVVAYSNKAKQTLLGVPAKLIAKQGAVSQAVAIKMSKSIRSLAKTDFGIGITGIAGPGPAGFKKPPGTVFIALDCQNKNLSKKIIFGGKRNQIRKQACLGALKILKRMILS